MHASKGAYIPMLCLEYADGRKRTIGSLPMTDVEKRIGPILADMVMLLKATRHAVKVPEIPTARQGAALQMYLATGRFPFSFATLEKAPAYKAAERLDIKGFVLAVERRAMYAIAAGGVRLDAVAAAFAGCPRMEALCDNYMSHPGVVDGPPPPPYNIRAMASEHGAILVVYQDDSYKVVVNMDAACASCASRCSRAKHALFDASSRFAQEWRKSRWGSEPPWDMRLMVFESCEPLAVGCIEWTDARTWLQRQTMKPQVLYGVLIPEQEDAVKQIASMSGSQLFP